MSKPDNGAIAVALVTLRAQANIDPNPIAQNACRRVSEWLETLMLDPTVPQRAAAALRCAARKTRQAAERSGDIKHAHDADRLESAAKWLDLNDGAPR